MNTNNTAADVCTASNEYAQLGHGVNLLGQTQGDTKDLTAASKCSLCLGDHNYSILFPAIAVPL
jgi:hypothetical protein